MKFGVVVPFRKPATNDALEVEKLAAHAQSVANDCGADGAMLVLTRGAEVVMTSVVGAARRDQRVAGMAAARLMKHLGW